MSPQRRTALASVVAAIVLIALKVAAGLHAGSLGLLSEAAHSGTDLVAALLTFFALGVAGRPADPGHPYGHGKAEHLAALAEAAILVLISLGIAAGAIVRLVEGGGEVDADWIALGVIGIVIAVDLSRTLVSARAARRYSSPAFAATALHFASDLGGSTAVLVGLFVTRAGYPHADAIAALFVSVLVLASAGRLIKTNVDVLMDRVPARARDAAEAAIAQLGSRVQLRRLRMRRAAGRHFADVVVAVPPAGGIEQGHAVADAVEAAVGELVEEATRRDEIEATLATGGRIVLVDGPEAAMAVVNTIAPEHLELVTEDPDVLVPLVRHAGAVFCGPWAPAVVGDYVAGVNHVLPTARTARFASALRVTDFQKHVHVVSLDEAAFTRVAPHMRVFADVEGLDAHGRSVVLRQTSREAATP
jgi:cation diffusion facilitator family transporter